MSRREDRALTRPGGPPTLVAGPRSAPLKQHLERDGFRLRGLDVSRIDAFSDVVFGFALTLLVVSLEVPKTFADLHASLRGFLPFAVCFLFLMLVWFAHYKFFRRFGLHDTATIALNAALLFVILFYVYPLKFLFTVAVFGLLDLSSSTSIHTAAQIPELMILFGLGYAAIFLLIAALYWNAWRQRIHLDLTSLEEFLTRIYVADAAGVAVVALLSCGVAKVLPAAIAGYAGWTFVLISPFRLVLRRLTRKRLAHLKLQSSLHRSAT